MSAITKLTLIGVLACGLAGEVPGTEIQLRDAVIYSRKAI